MAFAFEDAVIQTRRGPRNALVMTPREDYNVGRARLEELRAEGTRSPIDLSLVDKVKSARDGYRVVIFRGKSAGDTGRWRLDETLDADELQELARRLVLTQLPTWRTLIRAGVWVMVHTDLGSTALPMREGSRQLIDDPMRLEGIDDEIAEVDEWLLRHLVFWFSSDHEHAITTTLPDKLPLVELRADKIERFAETLRVATS